MQDTIPVLKKKSYIMGIAGKAWLRSQILALGSYLYMRGGDRDASEKLFSPAASC